MNPNVLLIPTMAIAALFFFAGRRTWLRITRRGWKAMLLIGSLALAVPGILFVIYYFHWFDNAVWFYQFRSLDYSELAAGGTGFLAGIVSAAAPRRLRLSTPFLLILLMLGIFIPHSKSVIFPVDYAALENECTNGYCLQTSNATCGPASAVTLLSHLGIEATERELARECYSYIGGTEVWYIARALRKRDLNCEFVIYENKPFELPYPAIAGVTVGAGHFITIIGEEGDGYIVGEPLAGRIKINKGEIFDRMKFTGFFLVVHNKT